MDISSSQPPRRHPASLYSPEGMVLAGCYGPGSEQPGHWGRRPSSETPNAKVRGHLPTADRDHTATQNCTPLSGEGSGQGGSGRSRQGARLWGHAVRETRPRDRDGAEPRAQPPRRGDGRERPTRAGPTSPALPRDAPAQPETRPHNPRPVAAAAHFRFRSGVSARETAPPARWAGPARPGPTGAGERDAQAQRPLPRKPRGAWRSGSRLARLPLAHPLALWATGGADTRAWALTPQFGGRAPGGRCGLLGDGRLALSPGPAGGRRPGVQNGWIFQPRDLGALSTSTLGLGVCTVWRRAALPSAG